MVFRKEKQLNKRQLDIKKDREKKIMYEKTHLPNDYNSMINQPPPQYPGSTSNFVGTAAPLSYTHKHLPTNYGNNMSLQPPSLMQLIPYLKFHLLNQILILKL